MTRPERPVAQACHEPILRGEGQELGLASGTLSRLRLRRFGQLDVLEICVGKLPYQFTSYEAQR